MDNPPDEEYYMIKQHIKFGTSLKMEVVRMIKEQGLNVQNVNQSIDIGSTAVRRWLAQCEAEQKGE
jgi:transposase